MAKRREPARPDEERRRQSRDKGVARRAGDAPPRPRRSTREQRPQRAKGSGPQTTPISRPVKGPGRPRNAAQAKARAKARKAKAPKVVRPPLRERLLLRLAAIEVNPRALVSRVPFVVLVIGALGLGLGVTLWLSTDAAERSYQLGHARQTNQALMQQKEALERDVLEAQAAPALAESARELGMIPSKDTAHLVQDPAGGWLVVGTPKPAEGVPPPPLNKPLPEEGPPAPPPPPAPRVVEPREQVVRLPAPTPAANPQIPVLGAPGAPAVAAAAPAAPGVPASPAQQIPTVGTAPGVPPDAAHPPALPAPAGPATPVVPDLPADPAVGPPTGAEHLASPQTPTLPGPSAETVSPLAPALPPVPGGPE